MKFTHERIFNASPSQIYESWLDSEKHSLMTGGQAEVSNIVGGEFTAWDGYITGKNIELVPNKKIIQSWRTSKFSIEQPDSILTIELLPDENGTKLILKHENLTEDDHHYMPGWVVHYFEPMKGYFNMSNG